MNSYSLNDICDMLNTYGGRDKVRNLISRFVFQTSLLIA